MHALKIKGDQADETYLQTNGSILLCLTLRNFDHYTLRLLTNPGRHGWFYIPGVVHRYE